ncbi:hypothetical protein FANTH_14855 [Fusarium anthophilum]|uniref:Uncharacterized protein n=1 Tax=Fusarium anthophilum TaxID=48485 RepID=A0A8H5DKN4_9HYPO|nr:hypothetical protein FANTH_14855 [Fusarium anthophilum]
MERGITNCNACDAEYYRDEKGPECPECNGKATETIDLGNDPCLAGRNPSISMSSDHHADAPELQEDEINELNQHEFAPSNSVRDDLHHIHRHTSNSGPTSNLYIFPAPRLLVPDGAFPSNPRERERNIGPRIIQRTSLPRLVGSTAISTLVSFTSEQVTRRNPATSLLQNRSRDIEQSSSAHEYGIEEGTGGLADLENLILVDVWAPLLVLDSIINAHVEPNLRSNAAPPATEEALANLERKPVDKNMLNSEGKAECTICIDGNKGERHDSTTILQTLVPRRLRHPLAEEAQHMPHLPKSDRKGRLWQ